MKKKISDMLYLCSPLLCFNIEVSDECDADGAVCATVTHYAPFVQQSLLNALLGDGFKITHTMSIDNFQGVDVRCGDLDGTLNGCLLAFKEFMVANLKDHVSPEDLKKDPDLLDFSMSITDNGCVSTTSKIITDMQEKQMLPTKLMYIIDMLSCRLPLHQALASASENGEKFVEPNSYRFFVDTAVGSFERNDIFGSYGIKSDALQGFAMQFCSTQPSKEVDE